jgi:cyclic pyranopterin phosphate synthase
MATHQRHIGRKPIVHRRAVAEGWLALRASTVAQIRRGRVAKGDPIAAGELACLLAMKRTPDLIPHCHVVALTGSHAAIVPEAKGVRITVEAESRGRTGVEMEALVGATIGLLTVWDMVKYLEKDARGLYPATGLGPVRVRVKHKGRPSRK